jgi:hypothetical protein
VGETGINIRGGPGTNYTRLGWLEAGTVVPVIGRYDDWWQVQYSGGVGWLYGDLVTAANIENVPQVEPPAPPPTAVPPTATPVPPPTAVPATSPPALPTDFRGLVANNFSIENAPGPFGNAGDIWFNFDVRNNSGGSVGFSALGAFVEETGQYQRSWTNGSISRGASLVWRDRINQFSLSSGTYHIWLKVCWSDGACDLMKGPVEVRIQ